MLYLNSEQKKLLLRLSKVDSLSCASLSSEELKIIYFLDREGLIDSKRRQIPTYNPATRAATLIPGGYISVSISEKGKSYLVEAKVDSARYKHPFIVSIIALLISLFSLILSLVSIVLQLN